jgi:hypothetical protein
VNYGEAVPIGLIWMPHDGTMYVAVRLSSRIFMPLKDLVQGTIGAHYLVVVISENVSVFRQYNVTAAFWTMQANV